jgi:uncharacterized RDD family membrane protein YckC
VVRKKDRTVTIETPEHFELQFELAGIGTRFVAFLVDRLIQLGLVLALIAMAVLVMYVMPRLGRSIDVPSAWAFDVAIRQWVIGGALLVYGLITIGYFIVFEYSWSGSTPGKRYGQIRVIRRDGRPISLVDSLVRNILRSVDLLFEVYPIGLAVMFLDSQGRRLGDLAAGTLVIMDRPVGKPATRSTAGQMEDWGTDLRDVVAAMTPEDYYIVSSFLSRRDSLDIEHRVELAREICVRLFGKTGMATKTKPDTEALLQAAAGLYRERTRVL